MRSPDRPFEEHPKTIEYRTHPEYTSVYPDISFFRESAVTMREENVFQGEIPPGEKPDRPRRRNGKDEEDRKKKEAAARFLMKSALPAGAVAFAAVALLSYILLKGGFGSPSGAAAGTALNAAAKRPAFNETQRYTNRELLALWNGEENAPHAYDYANPTVLAPATCLTDGKQEVVCGECGMKHVISVPGGHTPGPVRTENAVPATCGAAGSHDEVETCAVCGAEISRTHLTDPATGAHVPGDPVIENLAGSCLGELNYEEVVRCTLCGAELSRTARAASSPGHTKDGGTITDRKEPTCTADGYIARVFKCSVCGQTVSAETEILPSTGHVPGVPAEENAAPADCLSGARHAEVVSCTVCGAELFRNVVTEGEPLPHSWTTPSRDDLTVPRCTACGTPAISLEYDPEGRSFNYRIDPDFFREYVEPFTVSLDICSDELEPVCEPTYSGGEGAVDASLTTAKTGDQVCVFLSVCDSDYKYTLMRSEFITMP